MPISPYNKKCSELGCKNPRSKLNSFCSDHGGKEYVSKESDSIYQTPFWKSQRARQLSIQPLCQGCLTRGIVASAKHVDHVFAWKHIGRHAFTQNIFQSLCHNCHSYKTGLEKQGIYEHYTHEGVIQYTEHDYSVKMRQYVQGY